MNWTRFLDFKIPEYFQKELKDTAAALQERITQLRATRAQLDADTASFKSQTPTAVRSRVFPDAHKLRNRQVDLLILELALRGDLTGFYHVRIQAEHDAYDSAVSDHTKAQESIRKALAKLGYHDVPSTANDPCKIQPDMIFRHPKVFAATLRVEELRTRFNDHTHARHNRDAVASVEQHLRSVRDKAAAAV